MPYRYIEPEVYLEHAGVVVFCTYNGDDQPCKYWFTTDPRAADGGGPNDQFDARSFVGQWAGTPNVKQWDDWWKPRFRNEYEAVEALVTTAIDEGKVKSL